jgi:hypothetical protein
MNVDVTDSNNKVFEELGWKTPPSLKDLKQDYQDAKSNHDTQVTKIKEWLDNLNIEGAAKVNPPKGNSRIVPKVIRKQAEWRYAALSEPFLSSPDVFDVSPVSWEDRKAAQQNQLLLNNQFNTKIDKVKFIDEYVRTTVDEGTAIVRVGWDFQEEEYTEEVPTVEYVINPAVAPMIQQMLQMQQADPEAFAQETPEHMQQALALSQEYGEPVEAVVTGYEEQTFTRTVRNQPTLEICDFRNVIIDPSCNGDLDKAGFVIYSFESSRSALEKDGRYKNLDLINKETNSILGDPDHESENTTNFNFSDEARKKFVVYEYWGYWDIDGSGLVKPIVAAWVGDVLIRLEENPFPDGALPFVAVPYLPVRKSIYGEPDGVLIEDNQKVIGAVTRGMIDIMGKSANGQTGMRKDMLDATNRRKYEKGLDYEFNQNVDPRQGIHMHTYPEIPQSAQFMLQLQNMEAESLTGVKAFSGGLSGDSLGATATGIRGALDAASKREMGILRRLAAGIVKIGRKFIAMNAVFLDEEEVIRVTNEEFVPIRRDDLAGNFDLKLSISTAEEDNAKAQELAFMLQTMGNNMDAEMSKMILSDIARLRKMPGLAKRIEEYQPQPDPLEQKRRELELALLEAQIENERAHAMERQSGAMLDQTKAGNVQSDTDLKNLDFVEQEAGVKQERDLQKQRAQAEGNMRLELLKSQLGNLGNTQNKSAT